MDHIVGAEELPPTALKMRRLMHYGQIMQSHALHFFHLSSPDLLFGFDADPAIRNIVGVARRFPEIAKQGVLLRKFGQEVILATAGKKIHGTGAIPGGINKSLSVEERGGLADQMDEIMEWSRNAVKIAKDYTLENLEHIAPFGSFDSNHLSIVAADGAMDLYDGTLRAIDSDGETIFDQVPATEYSERIAEEVKDWSYMKFPFIRSIGPETGWYRVGPLARLNTCDYIDTPEAEAERQEFFSVTDGKRNNITLAYHWARMIELLHSAEKIGELLRDDDISGDNLVTSGERRQETVGILEAPRGTLIHHYRVNEDDQVVMANLIVSTTNNNMPMNRAVEKVARDHLTGQREITEPLLNNIEVAVRAYDPCLSCATHALGKMPLIVELVDSDGRVVDRTCRDSEMD